MVSTYPNNILCSSHSKAILSDGILLSTATALPGMAMEIYDVDSQGVIIYRPIATLDGTATCCILLDNQSMGQHVFGVVNGGDSITVAYIPSGEIFWGFISANSGAVNIGDSLTNKETGRLHSFSGVPPHANIIIAISLGNYLDSTEYQIAKMVAF